MRGVALDDRLFVGVHRARFFGRDEGRSDIGEVGAHRLSGENGLAGGDGAREQQRPVEPGADVLDQRERRDRAGVAAGARRDGDEAVRAFLDRLPREAVGDDVMQRDSAIAVHRRVDVLARAERGDDDRRLPLDRQRHVLFEPGVRLVHDLVDGEGRGRLIGMGAVMRRERLGDLVQPFVELRDRSGVERGKGADDPGLALGDHQRRMRDDEERRADGGQAQLVLQKRRQRHRDPHVRLLVRT